ncbi:MAG: YhbY family RNA-binding protein [Christensenellales bacterium]
MTSKQRAFLRSQASLLEPVVIIGKGAIDDNILNQIDGVLNTRELIKISILQSSDVDPKWLMDFLCEKLSAEPVATIGKKVILYRYSKKKNIKHIELN